jgi:TolA-binding protein
MRPIIMNEPRRWLDDDKTPGETSELLRALKGPRAMPPGKKAAMVGVLAGLASQSPRVASGMAWLKAAFLATVVVGAGVAVVAVTRHASPPPLAAPHDEAVPTSPPPTTAESPVATGAVEAVPAPAATNDPPRSTTQPSPSARSQARADTLADEEALLEEARRALSGSPGQALKLLRQHRQRFPNGELTAERLYLSAEAFARLGDKANAERQAKILLERFPSSAYARRVPSLLGSTPPTPP